MSAAAIQELKEMFPSWDREALVEVLAQVDGRTDAAIDLLLQWSCENQAANEVIPDAVKLERHQSARPVQDPVSPWHHAAGDAAFNLPPPTPNSRVPQPLERGAYDQIMARRLERHHGTRCLAEVMKIASLWHHRAHVHAVAKRHSGTGAAHLPDQPSPTAKDDELHDRLKHLSREESIVAGKELLRERCVFLGMQQREMVDDGNCQFRALSEELYGTQQHHTLVRQAIVSYLAANADEYRAFFEDAEWDHYLEQMAANKTWGDELTLRVAADALGVRIHLITSTEENWLLEYSPSAGAAEGCREVFMTYVAPIHYNTIEPRR